MIANEIFVFIEVKHQIQFDEGPIRSTSTPKIISHGRTAYAKLINPARRNSHDRQLLGYVDSVLAASAYSRHSSVNDRRDCVMSVRCLLLSCLCTYHAANVHYEPWCE